MIKIMFLSVAIILCTAILDTSSNITTTGKDTIIIESEETFKLRYDNLHKGKKITWDWKVEKNLLEPKYDLIFWIEDSDGNKYYEVVSSNDKGSFTVPLTNSWSLKWENPYHDESENFAFELSQKVEIVNQPPTALIKTDKTSGPVSLAVSFTGAGTDYDGVIVSYNWDFGDGNSSNAQNITHTFPNTGTYTVTFIVTDDDGDIGKDTVQIIVNNPTN